MPTLKVFNQVSLDGFIADEHGDMSWAHKNDPEWLEFVAGNARGTESVLLFGRVTYDMMASFWPTPMAKQSNPVVAEGMNKRQKVVFSRKLKNAEWENTRVVSGDIVAAVKAMKADPQGQDLVLMGSGSIVSQLSAARLVDEYQLIVNPIVLGRGKSEFSDVREKLQLQLKGTRAFKNGNVMLTYTIA